VITPVPLDLRDVATARAVLTGAGETRLGAIDAGGLVGALSWKALGDGTIDIHRLVVAPRAFRRGIAKGLLDCLDRTFPDRRMIVSTGSANEPALALYRRRGFGEVRRHEVLPGLSVTELDRPASRAG
jgi:ribosomal protein S18 acetylase RimI-like enzyme